MVLIPLQDTGMSYLEMLRLRAKKALGMDVFEEFQVSDNALSTLTSPKLPALMKLYSESLEEKIKLSRHFTKRYGDGQMPLMLVDTRDSSEGVGDRRQRSAVKETFNDQAANTPPHLKKALQEANTKIKHMLPGRSANIKLNSRLNAVSKERDQAKLRAQV
ncbi:hypothetical protein PsorP6_005553 [Peronosclerospora sorghi]|uniref:Uncharacterized protein n=1 Tax=Peronosclerospora sorghi TaxID=230839 RepID=A0ACC0W7Q6_9STRA|nr:hypothetical protein PsorP6_005553 [Peronosclerospora sorghi]